MQLPAFSTAGPIQTAVLWMRLILFALSFSTAIFSGVWMVLACSSMWMSAVGGSIMATCLFSMLLSLGSFACLLLEFFPLVVILAEGFTRQLHAAVAFTAHILCCVLMTLATESAGQTYVMDINDYINRSESGDSMVQDFTAKHVGSYAIQKYVAERSTDKYSSISTLFALWLPITLVHLFLAPMADKEEKKSAPRGSEAHPSNTNQDPSQNCGDEYDENRSEDCSYPGQDSNPGGGSDDDMA